MKYWPHKAMVLAGIVVLGVSVASSAGPSSSTRPVSKNSKSAHHSSKKPRKPRARGQQAIDGERCREIQQALVREHYMSGQPSGTWDDATQQAMRRYQADQGWQSKSVPDSRALIRLGLGPRHEHLLNPESAMTTEPQLPRGTQSAVRPKTVSSHSAAASPSKASTAQTSLPQSSTTVTPVSGMSDISPSH
jgi:hypothetical protein